MSRPYFSTSACDVAGLSPAEKMPVCFCPALPFAVHRHAAAGMHGRDSLQTLPQNIETDAPERQPSQQFGEPIDDAQL